MNFLEPLSTTSPRSRPLYSPDRVDLLMICLLRNEMLFRLARPFFESDLFTDEPHHSALWYCLTDLVDQHGFDCVNETRLRLELEERNNDELIGLTSESLLELIAGYQELPGRRTGLLHWAFEIAEDADLHQGYGIGLLKDFLRERAVARPIRSEFEQFRDITPGGLSAFLQRVQSLSGRIDAIGRSSVCGALIPDDFEWSPLQSFSTGCNFFDQMMTGQVNGETYGLIAPFGAGKSIMGIQLAVEAARYFARESSGDPRSRKHAYYFFYEGSLKEMRSRALSYAAEVDKHVIEHAASWNAFSTRGNLKSYEIANYQRRGLISVDDLPGENERLHAAAELINQNFHMVDFAGGEQQGAGSGGIDEIQSFLENERRTFHREPGLVVIDYCLKTVSREVEAQRKDFSKVGRVLVSAFPDRCRRQIASPFNVPVWILHQASGAASDLGPLAALGADHCAESKSFSESLYFMFGLARGNADSSYVSTLHTAKARRDGTTGRRQLVHLNGRLSRFESADAEFVVDSTGKSVVRRSIISTTRSGAEVGSQADGGPVRVAQAVAGLRRRRSINHRPSGGSWMSGGYGPRSTPQS